MDYLLITDLLITDPGWHYDHYLIVRAFLPFFLLKNQGIKQNTRLFQTFFQFPGKLQLPNVYTDWLH